jgi:hypothetical protein
MFKKSKFKVVDAETGEEIQNCFVLFPEHDKAAVEALETYAKNTVNAGMANILKTWATRVRERQINPEVKPFNFRLTR